MVLQMSEMDKKISDAFATPEHVEGDVLSVGEMEVVTHAIILPADHIVFGPEPFETPKGQKSEPLVTLTSATTRIQRAERERDSATSTLKYCERQWSEERGTMIDKFMYERNRADAAEAQLADAVKVLEPLANMAVPPKPQGNAGFYSVRHSAILAARTFLSTIGEKPDAE